MCSLNKEVSVKLMYTPLSYNVHSTRFQFTKEWPGTHCFRMRKNLWKTASEHIRKLISHMAMSSKAVYE